MPTVTMPADRATPGGPQAGRVLPIRADLMPPEVLDARRARRARNAVLGALAAFAVVLAGWYGVATYQTVTARDELARATAEADALRQQQQQYGEVIRVQTRSEEITGQLSALLANDVRWANLFTALRTAAPRGVRVSSVSATLATTGGQPATGGPVVGTLEVNGSAPDKVAVAGYIDKLAAVPGLANPLLNGASNEEDGVRFALRVEVTSAALGGRYTTAKPPGGK